MKISTVAEKPDEKDIPPNALALRQKAKCDAGILGMHNVEKTRNHPQRFQCRDVRFNNQLAQAVEYEYPEGNREWNSPELCISAGQPVSPRDSFHTIGHNGGELRVLTPRPSLYFQQRSHLSSFGLFDLHPHSPPGAACSSATCDTMNKAGSSAAYSFNKG